MAFEVVSETKKYAKKPLVVKLSPNVTDIAEIACASESAGASALSLINTVLGMRIDIKTRRPFSARTWEGCPAGCFSHCRADGISVKKAVKIPLIGMGGIRTGDGAVEMMLAGRRSSPSAPPPSRACGTCPGSRRDRGLSDKEQNRRRTDAVRRSRGYMP
jgi:dihydroorotate dehydrogenase (NAD+) catalytic subunit